MASAARAGLDVIALTDHDSTDGWAEASAAATAGPFGAYREEGLRGESSDGRRYEPGAEVRDALGERGPPRAAHLRVRNP